MCSGTSTEEKQICAASVPQHRCSYFHCLHILRLTFNLGEAFGAARSMQGTRLLRRFRIRERERKRIDGLWARWDSTALVPSISLLFIPFLSPLFLFSRQAKSVSYARHLCLRLPWMPLMSQKGSSSEELSPFQRVWPGHNDKCELMTLTWEEQETWRLETDISFYRVYNFTCKVTDRRVRQDLSQLKDLRDGGVVWPHLGRS